MRNTLRFLSRPNKSLTGLPLYEPAQGTMARPEKGPVTPLPALDGLLKTVADELTGWPGIIATSHWDLYCPTRVDGIDFYVGEQELGHLHLDGDAHIATSPSLGKALVAEGSAKPLPYVRGWVEENVHHIGANAMINLFRCNYNRLSGTNIPK